MKGARNMKKEKWDNLIDFFPGQFNSISEIQVYLFLEIPRIFSFKAQDGLMYLAYIAEIDYEFYDTKWIVAQVDLDILKKMLKEEISIKETLINRYNHLYLIELAESDCVNQVNTVDIEVFLPSSNFYLSNKLPNEINLSEVIDELLPLEHILDMEINYNSDAIEENDLLDVDFIDEFSNLNKVLEVNWCLEDENLLPCAS